MPCIYVLCVLFMEGIQEIIILYVYTSCYISHFCLMLRFAFLGRMLWYALRHLPVYMTSLHHMLVGWLRHHWNLHVPPWPTWKALKAQKIPESIRRQIDDHIHSFPVMKSHYSRARQSQQRKYLSPLLSVSEIHSLYLEKYQPQERSQKLLTATTWSTSMKILTCTLATRNLTHVELATHWTFRLGQKKVHRRHCSVAKRKTISDERKTSIPACIQTHA